MSEAKVLVDPAAVERLKRLGGNEFVVKMIDLFSSYAAEKLTAAQQALSADNLTGLADAVHPIKSSAGNVGAVQVQELAKQIEHQARQSDRAGLADRVTELERAFLGSKSELERIKTALAGGSGGAK